MMQAAHQARTAMGPYRLLAKIGEGGMGTVYLARMDGPAGVDKLAVVKELRSDVAREPDFMAMFLNEAKLAARLTHPNVVHTYGASEDDGRLYIAMEYLDGQPWVRVRHRLWNNRSLPLSLHLHVIAETLAGLHYAHSLKSFNGSPLQVVHCDVSPQNVFVTYDGQVKIVDFGVARAVTSTGAENQDLFAGKVSYAAPEQILRQTIDRRADVFAVGVMLWEALAGRRFAEGFEQTEVLRRRVGGKEPRVRDVVPSVPRALADMCDRALCIDPRDRFATAADFRNAILDYLSDTAQRTDNSQLGNTVDAAFREERSNVHRFIETSLTHPEDANQGTLPDLGVGTDLAEDTLRADLSEFVSVSRIADDHALAEASAEASVIASVRPDAPSKPARPKLAALGAAAIAVVVGILIFRMAQTSAGESNAPSATLPTTTSTAVDQVAPPLPPQVPTQLPGSAAATASGPAAERPSSTPDEPARPAADQPAADQPEVAPDPVPATITLELAATPQRAVIAIDGSAVAGNPYIGAVRRSTRLHTVSAWAPGFERQERHVRFDQGREVHLNLVPVRPPNPTRRKWRPAQETGANASLPIPASEKASTPRKPTRAANSPKAAQPAPAREIYEEDPY